jgi:hypothetical protein
VRTSRGYNVMQYRFRLMEIKGISVISQIVFEYEINIKNLLAECISFIQEFII